MAQRRMFSLKIVGSARFLKMPVDSQTLYFHLGMYADDDGVVEAYPVLKTTGSSDDNLRVLVSKGFIKVLNEDLVSFITDWKEHNLLRADRKVDSIYKDLLLQLVPDTKLIEPKPRADTGKPTGRPMDDQWTPQDRIGEDRIGEDRIGEDRIGKDKGNGSRFAPPSIKEIKSYCIERSNSVDSEQFHAFYESKGWMVGKNKMKDWRASVRTWEKRSKIASSGIKQINTNLSKYDKFN